MLSRHAALVRADAVAVPLADASVDLVVTSPPYFALRSYQDGGEHYDGQIGSEETPQAFLEALWAVTAECARVLKPSGSIFVNLGDKYAGSGGHNNAGLSRNGITGSLNGNTTDRERTKHEVSKRATRRNAPDRYIQGTDFAPAKSLMLLPERFRIGCVDRLGLIARAVVVWSKPNGMPESVTDRVRRSHEDWVHLTREPRYFSAVDEVREPYNPNAHDPGEKAWGDASYATWGTDGSQSLTYEPGTRTPPNPLGKLPGSVWTVPGEPLKVPEHLGVDHFAAFPQEWPRRLILGWSPPDGVVLDPFACDTPSCVRPTHIRPVTVRENNLRSGITMRQLDYWARTHLVRPSIAQASGSGTQRRYSYGEVIDYLRKGHRR